MKRILLAVFLSLLSAQAHAAATAYKICDLPGGTTLQASDHIEISRNCGGSYNLTGTQIELGIAAYAFANAPGTPSGIFFNSGGTLATGSASFIRGLLGLAPVAASGLYVDLSDHPTALSQFSNDSGFVTALTAPVRSINGQTGTPVLTTSNISEGSALYFTSARADSRIASAIGGTVEAWDSDLDALAALSGTGYAKRTGSNNWSVLPNIPNTDISGLGTLATQSGTFSGTSSGNNSGDQTITLTGDATGSGTGAFAVSIAAGHVTNAMLAGSIAASKLVGTDITTLGTVTSAVWNATPIGSSYGGAGTVNGIEKANGAGQVSAAVAGTDYAPGATANAEFFGDGSDGDVTCTGVSTLVRDMFYHNLTVQSGCAITAAAFKIFIAGTLDITAAPAGGITRVGAVGSTGSASGTGGATGSALTSATLGGSTAGATGGAGGTTTGSTGTAGTNASPSNGAPGGASGAGGSGSSGAGGTNAVGGTVSGSLTIARAQTDYLRGIVLIVGGAGGASGGGGGGDGTAGAGGGGSGSGGGILTIYANTVSRGASTTAAAITAAGGAGGIGGTAAAGNRGGGGGAGGGGGGSIYLLYGTLVGSTATNVLDVSGGAGGNGGDGFGTGVGGNGGTGGKGGTIVTVNLLTGATTHSTASGSPAAGGTASGTTHGTGTAGYALQGSL